MTILKPKYKIGDRVICKMPPFFRERKTLKAMTGKIITFMYGENFKIDESPSSIIEKKDEVYVTGWIYTVEFIYYKYPNNKIFDGESHNSYFQVPESYILEF